MLFEFIFLSKLPVPVNSAHQRPGALQVNKIFNNIYVVLYKDLIVLINSSTALQVLQTSTNDTNYYVSWYYYRHPSIGGESINVNI